MEQQANRVEMHGQLRGTIMQMTKEYVRFVTVHSILSESSQWLVHLCMLFTVALCKSKSD